MRRDRDYFNRMVPNGDSSIRVCLRPRGSELRDLTKDVAFIHWFTMLPGLISVVGWALHHTVWRSGWLVTAQSDEADHGARALQLAPMRKREAEQVFLNLLDWLEAGQRLEDFRPAAA